MISFKCKNCGGEMSVSRNGGLFCSYCGTRTVFSDSELREYREFRAKMLEYLSAVANTDSDPAATESVWFRAEHTTLRADDGSAVEIKYLFKGEQDGVEIYTARNNALFRFKAGDGRAARFSAPVGALRFPAADVRDLKQFFPVFNGEYVLEDGGTLLAVKKPETAFPLSAFGGLPPEHAAWIVSRLENLCCVLAYSGLAHNGIGMESVFIDPGKHSAYLLGGWWNARPHEDGSAADLAAVRETAGRVLGVYADDAPAAFKDFLSGPPRGNAYDDFAAWDGVICSGFGGRRFVKLDLCSLK